MKKIFLALLLLIPSISFAAWSAADIALCKSETTREFNSRSVYYVNGVKQPISAFQTNAYNAALARCNASIYVLFDVISRHYNTYYNQLIGISHYQSPIRPEYNEVGPQAMAFTFNRSLVTSALEECKIPNGLSYPSNNTNCDGNPLQYTWSVATTSGTATGTEYSFRLGFSFPSTTASVYPVYSCRSTIEQWFNPPNPPVYTTRWASFSSTCNNGLHSTANTGVTNLGLLGYAYAVPSANYQ